jgi:hypothetical protein
MAEALQLVVATLLAAADTANSINWLVYKGQPVEAAL